MKKIALALVILAACFNLTAQETEPLEETRGFKKENLFLPAEKRIYEFVFVENLQMLNSFANTDVLHRNPELV